MIEKYFTSRVLLEMQGTSGRRILSSQISRNPIKKFLYFHSRPLISLPPLVSYRSRGEACELP